MAGRGEPVLAGVMENVVQCRRWDQWDRWIGEVRALGYETRVIALNSAHALPPTCLPVPQSRDRLYVAYWLKALGRQPDWDKWLRPKAWCGSCEQVVDAVQSWKKPGVEMGRYGVRHGQYAYRCPSKACRFAIVEPITTPASVAIDWTLPPGARIGDREEPLADNTLERIRIGLEKFAGAAMLTPAGGTWRPDGGHPAIRELPTQTCRRELSVVIPPFIAKLRGGGSKKSARALTEPLATSPPPASTTVSCSRRSIRTCICWCPTTAPDARTRPVGRWAR
ncbi:hypothetical protein B7C42_00113 [Nocardia cerradoensis]|uniref:DNA (cytosine-5-)-methyltransferase n=1 Tax=Nocardia cerradoensis TaxID=85688 RepID=A0A231HE68_9NOCA|nr:DNA cytosine methyltransferase [Nocardia cerradoensis]OXR46997.1 hypothetical protein B7C42_00113 [Nocardia cerradoensis]